MLALTPGDLEQRKRIVGLQSSDVARIRELAPALKPRAAELAAAFFEHLAEFDAAQPLLGEPALFDEARELKLRHLEAMFDGDYGVEYAAQRVRLGELYARAGLPPQLFLGAFRRLLQRIDTAAADPARFDSVRKLGFFDISIIVDVLIAMRERVIVHQQEAIKELSTPVLQLRERLLLVPVVGAVDTPRARQLTESMLRAVNHTRARAVVVDVTGVAHVDTKVAHHLFQTVAAARLMGVRVFLSGLSPQVSQSLTVLGIDAGTLDTLGDLQGAIEQAERYLANPEPSRL